MGDIYEMENKALNSLKKRTSVSIIIATIMCAAQADCALLDLINSPDINESFTIYWENDGTLLKPFLRTDRHYTNGMKLAYTHQPEWDLLKEFGKWNNFGQNDGETRTAIGYFVAQNMYTPDHVDIPVERDRHDQVFAGWLYGGAFAQRATENQMEHFELNLGVIGPSAEADHAQHNIHKWLGLGLPIGWDNQLKNELEADFTWFKRQRADGLLPKHTENYDWNLEYGFTAGTVYRNANAGIIARFGSNLPNDFGPGRLEAPGCAARQFDTDRTHLYFFTRLGCKVVQFNRFLTGLDEKLLVGQAQFGIVWKYKSFEISYSQTFLTKEYKEQPQADSTGALNLTYYF
jgi:hypothetical protein